MIFMGIRQSGFSAKIQWEDSGPGKHNAAYEMEGMSGYGKCRILWPVHTSEFSEERAGKKDRPKAVVFLRESSQAFFCKACISAITC